MKLIYGLGIYRKGKYPATLDRKATKTYTMWANMIKRCTPCTYIQDHHQSYIGCECDPSFIEYQNFAEWCQSQVGFGIEGYELDKDILIPGNKIYGPDTCVFVPKALNLLLVNNSPKHGLPLGVTYIERDARYKARLSINGVQKNLGHFDSPSDAHKAYQTAKLNYIHVMAKNYQSSIDYRVYDALLKYQV